MAGNLANVITCAKFQDEICRGYDFTGGRISHFPIDFCMGLTTVQRDCAACDFVLIGRQIFVVSSLANKVSSCSKNMDLPYFLNVEWMRTGEIKS